MPVVEKKQRIKTSNKVKKVIVPPTTTVSETVPPTTTVSETVPPTTTTVSETVPPPTTTTVSETVLPPASTTPLLPTIDDENNKKTRVSTTLPAKYAKFIQFAYYFMNKLHASTIVDGNEVSAEPMVDQQQYIAKLGLFDSIEYQQALVQEFFDSNKTINAEMKKMISQRKRQLLKDNKPIKVPKIKAIKELKESKKPTSDTETETDENVVPIKTKKTNKVKKVKTPPTTEDTLVNELVTLATATKKESAIAAVNTLFNKHKDPIIHTNTDTYTSEFQERGLRSESEGNEAKSAATLLAKDFDTHTDTHTDTQDSELQVSLFEYNGRSYLIDDLQNVYDFTTHDIVATYTANLWLPITPSP